MTLFGPFAALSKAVAAMAEMEVSPQEEMANPQGKCSPLGDLGFLKISCLFLLCWSAIVATRICSESAVCSGSATVVGTGADTVLEVRVLLS